MFSWAARCAVKGYILIFTSSWGQTSPLRVLFFHFIFIQRSQYIKPKVTVHKCAGVIRTRVLFEGGPYMRKYGKYNTQCKIDYTYKAIYYSLLPNYGFMNQLC